jgi:GGDEF domain-containing protein
MDDWPRGAPLPARPVADAPRPTGETLAKSWLIALMAKVPLQAAETIRVAELAHEAPVLADALVLALRNDSALDRLRPDGDLEPIAARVGALAGARDAASAAEAVDTLRTVAWGVLRSGLAADPDPRLVADLAERLALVAATITAAALRGADGALLADAGTAAPTPAVTGPFHLRDARDPVRDHPWLRPIDFALARQSRTGEPFTVLLADLDDVERLVAVWDGSAPPSPELAEAVSRVEDAVRGQLRGEDAFVRERIGRYWIVASGLGDAEARELAGRIADAVRTAATLQGAPLTVSIGLASGPGDAGTADELVGRADEGVFAARAAGLPNS